MTWTDIALHGIYALLIVVAGQLVGSWLAGLGNLTLERMRVDPSVRHLLVGLIRPVVLALAVFAALAQLGIPSVTFAAVAGAITLTVGLALQGTLSNVAAGGMLLSIRPYSVDDTVTLAGVTGRVRSLQMFTTVLDTHDGRIVTVPNALAWGSPIVVHTATPNSRVELTWVLPAHADLPRAEAEIRAALAGDARVHAEPGPNVLWGATSEQGVALSAVGWVANADLAAARSELQRAVLQRFADARIPWSVQPTPRGR